MLTLSFSAEAERLRASGGGGCVCLRKGFQRYLLSIIRCNHIMQEMPLLTVLARFRGNG